jgi:hypothetical protein
MDFQPQTFHDLEDRVLELEKQNRRLKRFGIVVLIFPALLLVMGQAPARRQNVEAGTITANEFQIKDSKGRVRVEIGMNLNGWPQLSLFEPTITIPRVVLSADPKEGPLLMMIGERGSTTFTPKGFSFLWPGAGAALDKDTGYYITDATGRTYLSGGSLRLEDHQRFSAILGTAESVTPRTGEKHTTSAASLVMVDKDGHTIWKAP